MLKSFSEIKARAVERKGGEAALGSLLPSTLLTPAQLTTLQDEYLLAEMTRSIFQSGFNWSVIDKKWSGFEAAFWQFNIACCASISAMDFEALYNDTRIVRNKPKINAVCDNANMILAVQQSGKPFAQLIAEWPATNFIGLLAFLNKNGSRLGGLTAQYFLRHVGYDGFVLGHDGVAALIDAGVIHKKPTSQSDMKAVQAAFNQWMTQSGLGLAQISRILALSIDAPSTL